MRIQLLLCVVVVAVVLAPVNAIPVTWPADLAMAAAVLARMAGSRWGSPAGRLGAAMVWLAGCFLADVWAQNAWAAANLARRCMLLIPWLAREYWLVMRQR